MSKQALIVFAKPPVPGKVKTRLSERLSPEGAATLYKAFLYDALSQYTSLGVAVRLYVAGPEASVAPFVEQNEKVTVHTQSGQSLGKRMARAFVDTFASGFERCVIIGTDHPTLPSSFIQKGFDCLDVRRSLVLGPSSDGGYYCLGMNDYFPEVFHEMSYSHGEVFNQTLSRAERAGAAISVLPPWYDVDESADLDQLLHDLEEMPATVAPETRQALHTLGLLESTPHV